MQTPRPPLRSADRGFSYAEILLSVALLVLMLTPALEALQTAMMGTPAVAATPGRLGLQSKLEEVLAAPYSKIYGETYVAGANTPSFASALFSDAAGTPQRRLVVIYRYDASTRTLATGDTGLAFVSVYYEAEGPANALNTLTGRWW